MEWFYASNGQQKGPISQATLEELFRNGTISSTDLVWNESMIEWTPIGTLPAFTSTPFPSSPSPAAPSAPHPSGSPLPTSTSPATTPSPLGSVAPNMGMFGAPPPPTYLWQSIVVMVLCCLPFGIPALIFSTKVNSAMAEGNYNAAVEASGKAKMWCLIALIAGVISQILWVGLSIFLVSQSN